MPGATPLQIRRLDKIGAGEFRVTGIGHSGLPLLSCLAIVFGAPAPPGELASMARILVIASYTPPWSCFGGDLLREFIARGHEVTCCSPDPDEPTLQCWRRSASSTAHTGSRRHGHEPGWPTGHLSGPARHHGRRPARPRAELHHQAGHLRQPVAAGRQKVPAISAMITGLGTTFLGSGPHGPACSTPYARFMYRARPEEMSHRLFPEPRRQQGLRGHWIWSTRTGGAHQRVGDQPRADSNRPLSRAAPRCSC